MTTSQLITVNTIASYGRTVFGMALGLFSGRWMLQALGPVDYGLIGVVGAAIIFITFLNGITANSVARFLALSIGKGDAEETSRWFNTALSIHTVLPSILILIGWPIGDWAIQHFFNIPPDRLWTARWVFKISLVSAFFGMTTTPFIAMFVAKQRIFETSLWSILSSSINFCFVFFLTKYQGDVWLLYSGGTVAIAIGSGLCQVLRARVLFPECRIHLTLWWDKSHLRPLFSFAGWQLFGGVAAILRGQGTAILLNKFFPPLVFPQVNASYTVGTHVAGYTQTLSTALIGAFTPEITASEGRGDRAKMLEHANRASKFSVYLILLFAVPVFLEIDFLLLKWLKTPPDLANTFCRLLLAMFLIDKLTFGQMVAVNAKGRIAGYQATLGGFLLLTLPIAWLFLRSGFDAVSVSWAAIITMLLCSAGRIGWAKVLVDQSPWVWARVVCYPSVLTFGAGLLVGTILQHLFPGASWPRFLIVGFGTLASWAICGWAFLMSRAEKAYIVNGLLKLRMKACRR